MTDSFPDTNTRHAVLDAPLLSPWPAGTEVMYVAAGCFWGMERIMWNQPGVVATAVGYMGGHRDEPEYRAVCSGMTGHAETVLVAYDPSRTSPDLLLKAFWENHDPTTKDRQGNDIGSQYRSEIFVTTPQQDDAARRTRSAFQGELDRRGFGMITTQITDADTTGPARFWYAERAHQQYLHHNPGGYCNHGPHGVSCPVGVADVPAQTDVMPS